jgi:hypothetical protein
MKKLLDRPVSVTLAVGLITLYAAMVILWDLLSPFERPYAQGPATVVLGLRVFGVWAQLTHVLQLSVAVGMAYGLWTMQRWGWQLVLFVAGYMLLSSTVWMMVYQEFGRAFFAFLNLVIVNILLVLTFPHREKFV